MSHSLILNCVFWYKKRNVTKDTYVIEKFFKGIFQSEIVASNPVISDAENDIENFNHYCDITDQDLTVEELRAGVLKMKKAKE